MPFYSQLYSDKWRFFATILHSVSKNWKIWKQLDWGEWPAARRGKEATLQTCVIKPWCLVPLFQRFSEGLLKGVGFNFSLDEIFTLARVHGNSQPDNPCFTNVLVLDSRAMRALVLRVDNTLQNVALPMCACDGLNICCWRMIWILHVNWKVTLVMRK